jgi:hypothetical protein
MSPIEVVGYCCITLIMSGMAVFALWKVARER